MKQPNGLPRTEPLQSAMDKEIRALGGLALIFYPYCLTKAIYHLLTNLMWSKRPRLIQRSVFEMASNYGHRWVNWHDDPDVFVRCKWCNQTSDHVY
jgi:hypothetical protein